MPRTENDVWSDINNPNNDSDMDDWADTHNPNNGHYIDEHNEEYDESLGEYRILDNHGSKASQPPFKGFVAAALRQENGTCKLRLTFEKEEVLLEKIFSSVEDCILEAKEKLPGAEVYEEVTTQLASEIPSSPLSKALHDMFKNI